MAAQVTSAAAEAESAIGAQAAEADAAAAAQAAGTENATTARAPRAEATAVAAQATKDAARGSRIRQSLHMRLPTSRAPTLTMHVPTAMLLVADPTVE